MSVDIEVVVAEGHIEVNKVEEAPKEDSEVAVEEVILAKVSLTLKINLA